MKFFRVYNDLLQRRPFLTNMTTTGFFFGAGDVLAQSMFPHIAEGEEESNGKFYYPRTVRAATYGSLFFAPISVIWHRKTLPYIKNPLISKVRRQLWIQTHPKLLHFYDVIFRVTLDQLFITSLVWIPMYNVVMVTLAGYPDPLGVARSKLEANWWNVLKASWTVWPGFQFVNLFFIPVQLRVVAANIWSVFWNSYLSFIHNTPGHGKGSGKRVEELVDIQDGEITMVYD